MKSRKEIDNYHFPFDLYRNPLSKEQKKFLENPNYRGKNPYDTADAIEEKLEKSFRTVYHILVDHQRLEESKVYDVVNAKSMQIFLEAAIQKNDFRTAELVRILFEMAIFYLKHNRQFKELSDVIDDLAKPLSKYFKLLSQFELGKENADETISKEERDEIKKYLKNHDSEKDYKRYLFHKQRNSELLEDLCRIDLAKRLKKTEIDPEIPHEVFEGKFESNVDSIVKQIQENDKILTELNGESFLRESQIRRLSNTYNHLESYASRIKPLDEFDYLLGRIGLEGSYIKDTDSEFLLNKLNVKFHDLMYEKFKDKTTNISGPSVLHFNSDQTDTVKIPKNVWDEEKRKFFTKHGIKLDKKFHPIKNQVKTNYFETLKYQPKWFGREWDVLFPWN